MHTSELEEEGIGRGSLRERKGRQLRAGWVEGVGFPRRGMKGR